MSHNERSVVPLHVRAQQLGIDITKQGIHTVVEKSRKLIKGAYGEALRDIYGPEMDTLHAPGALEPATNLFTPLLNNLFDEGCNRDVECEVLYKGRVIKMREKPERVYSRTSFISKILHDEELMNTGSISIGRVDLARFKDADFDVDNAQEIRPADVMINTAAHVIHEVLKEVGGKYEVGRYGGDELIIAFMGEKAQVRKEDIMKRISKRLSLRDGFYKNAEGQIETRPITFKTDEKSGNTVEWIEFPPSRSREEKEMYKEYLRRGLMLSVPDFDREQRKYTRNGIFDFTAYRQDYPEQGSVIAYPDTVRGTADKIQYLTGRYSEFSLYFGFARLFDLEDAQDTTHLKRQATLLTVVENSIFDKLLGEMIYSKAHFMKHMKRGEIGEIFVVDFKNLKEMNTARTYADADQCIRKLWEKIKEAIPEDERHKIMVGRFGGADYIGVRKGEHLKPSTQESLKNITTLTIEAQEPITVPLGHAYLNLESEGNTDMTPYDLLSQVDVASDKAYYMALAADMQQAENEDPTFMQRMASMNLEELVTRPYSDPLTKCELYALVLRGKRGAGRLAKMLQALGDTSALRPHLEEVMKMV